MPKVISLVPQQRFTQGRIEVPSDWDLIFLLEHGEKDIIEACKGADYLLVTAAFPPVTESVLQNIPSVRLLQVFGAGFDKVNVDAAHKLKLPVANTPGQNASTVAEFTLGVLVSLQRKMLKSDREVKAGNHILIKQELVKTGLKEIKGTRVGLVGLGTIGRLVARLLNILGARVSYYDPFRLPESDEDDLGVTYCSLQELLQHNEVISLHLPLNNDTRSMIGKEELASMQPEALLINTSRGEVVDQVALAEALEDGVIGGAAVDTFFPEPPPADHPLLNLSGTAAERVILTPHIAGVTAGSFARMLKEAVENIQQTEEGGAPKYVVNGILRARARLA